ncbi:hypothetical protein Tco_0528314 [Tanacetum coccineum]
MVKKFGLENAKPIKTPMSSETKLTRGEEGEPIDDTKYPGMIGSLLYLTASRPDIMFSVCLCARFQETPKTSHLKAVKQIFCYIKGTSYLGLWYPKGTGLETIFYADFDHVGDYVDQKSTSGLTNLNLDERFALNVALRMYTRRIVIQDRVDDLQLAVESYQKKINLSRPDSYHLVLRKMTPYTAYHNIQGIIYQDDMDRNRLMRIDELHKFSDSTLNHVCTALNDIATGIQMEYLPKRKWSKQDK